jgi:hypothetical protein
MCRTFPIHAIRSGPGANTGIQAGAMEPNQIGNLEINVQSSVFIEEILKLSENISYKVDMSFPGRKEYTSSTHQSKPTHSSTVSNPSSC